VLEFGATVMPLLATVCAGELGRSGALNRMRRRIGLLLVISFLFCEASHAKVAYLTPDELFADSDLVCIAKVLDVERVFWMPKRKYATASVIEVWKGPSISHVTFRAYPTWACDISSAEEGETVLLFLERSKNGKFDIANSGYGRWKLNVKPYNTRLSVSEYDLMPPKDRSTLKDWSKMRRTQAMDLKELREFLVKRNK
jgi:hypothetical protein